MFKCPIKYKRALFNALVSLVCIVGKWRTRAGPRLPFCIWSRKKGRSGDRVLSFKKNPSDLKENRTWNEASPAGRSTQSVSDEQCRSLCVLLNCFCTLHACTPQTSRCWGARHQGDGFQTRLFRRTVNRGAGRTLLGLCGVHRSANYLWEKWEGSSARRRGCWGNCDCDSHILLSHWSTLVYFIPNAMQMPYAIYGSRFICSARLQL